MYSVIFENGRVKPGVSRHTLIDWAAGHLLICIGKGKFREAVVDVVDAVEYSNYQHGYKDGYAQGKSDAAEKKDVVDPQEFSLSAEAALQRTHEALDNLLALFVQQSGKDFNAVSQAVKALAVNLNLPQRERLYLPITSALWPDVETEANKVKAAVSVGETDNG